MFGSNASSLNLKGSKRFSLDTPSPHLENAFGMIIAPNQLFIRSGVIDTYEKRVDLLQLAGNMLTSAKMPVKKRLSSLQLNILENEWELIHSQHLCLLESQDNRDFALAHISLPTEFLLHKRDIPSEFAKQTLSKLLKQFNAEGWITYSKWLSEEVESVLAGFKPEDSEEYQLQALLEDFLHEVHSSLLRQLLEEMARGRMAQIVARSKQNRDEIYASEVAMVKIRDRLTVLLQIQSTLLEQVIDGIVTIEGMHPELASLRLMASALSKLISGISWGQSLLVLDWLNIQLGVISAVNCDQGLFRTNLAFAIQFAFAESFAQMGAESLDFCLKWDQISHHLQQKQLREFQESVWEICKALNLKGKSRTTAPDEEDLNPQLAAFLPFSLTIQVEDHSKQVPMFIRDPQTHQPIGCTPIGERLLRRMGLIPS